MLDQSQTPGVSPYKANKVNSDFCVFLFLFLGLH